MSPTWRIIGAFGLVVSLCAATLRCVDLQPHVGSDFFFAEGDPALEEDRTLAGRFGGLSQVVILASSPDVEGPVHRRGIERLTAAVRDVPGTLTVHSLSSAPDDLEDARDSPLWSRLLLAGDGSTSFVIAEVETPKSQSVVAALEEVVADHERDDFQLALAGVPYTVEVMRRKLVRDFGVFSAAAVAVFGCVVLWMFRSAWILVGTLATCTGAVAATLLVLDALGFGIGLLTANLTTIVFVLAQSHVVFMGSNWQRISAADETDADARISAARRRTLPGSVASAATTMLGFGSLILVPARPLEELGVGGTVGAAIALLAAYSIFPEFLRRATPQRRDEDRRPTIVTPRPVRALVVGLVAMAFGTGLARLDADPSLLDYFDEDGEVHRALATLDRAGGGSPLTLAVQTSARERLDDDEPFGRLWTLHRSFEDDPAVGRAISLPILVAEANRSLIASLLPRDWLLGLIGPETTGAFLTRDRRQTLYLLQMSDRASERPRREIIDRLEEAAGRHGFDVVLVGGIFALQARLSELVAQSMLWSLGALVLLFAAVSTFAARSLRVGVAAGASAALVPIATLGGFGVFGVPLDVIAAPAASVGLGLAGDAALHVIVAWRRLGDGTGLERWTKACHEQWRGVVRSTGVVSLGFALFALSGFPPTRRFGLGVAVATALGAIVALWVLPVVASRLGGGREGRVERDRA